MRVFPRRGYGFVLNHPAPCITPLRHSTFTSQLARVSGLSWPGKKVKVTGPRDAGISHFGLISNRARQPRLKNLR
jgi:hypothetical protein